MKSKSTRGVGIMDAGLVVAGLIAALLASGCAKASTSSGGMMCGDGTVLIGRYCVSDDSIGSGSGPSSSASTSSSSGSGGSGSTSSSSSSGAAGGSSTCTEGANQSCYSGPTGTQNVGVCHSGTQTCTGGNWGPCVGEVTPSAETCDGFDNNCNGALNDGLGSLSCGVGQCAKTVPACVNGQPGTCAPGTPSSEVCDGADNNCDGLVDDGNPGGAQPCDTGLPGTCAPGTTACTSGQITCNLNAMPSPEICDGIDNDCDYLVDDNVTGGGQACQTGLSGVCAIGTTACAGGQITCTQTAQPSAEICDGLDNNCDGTADEGCTGCFDPVGIVSGSIMIGPSDAVVPLCSGKVLVGNRVQNRLETFNVTTGTMGMSWQLSSAPGDIILDAPNNTVYITLSAAAQLAKVELGSPAVVLIPLSAPAVRLALGNAGMVFASLNTGAIAIVEGMTSTTMPVPGNWGYGTLIAFDRPSNQLIVGDGGLSPSSLQRYAFDPVPKTLTHLQERWDAGGNGQHLTISPDGNHVVFSCGGGNGAGYTMFDFSSDDLNITYGEWNTGAYPRAASFSADGARLVATNGDEVKLFETTTHALLKTYPVYGCSYGMLDRVAFSPGGAIAYAISKCGFSDDSGELYWFVQ